jgi:hypothetical protein
MEHRDCGHTRHHCENVGYHLVGFLNQPASRTIRETGRRKETGGG